METQAPKKDRPPDSGREDSEQAAKFREEQRKPPNPEGMTARKRKLSKDGGDDGVNRYAREDDGAQGAGRQKMEDDGERTAKFREEQRKPPNPEGMTARKRRPSKVGGWCASRYPRDKDSA